MCGISSKDRGTIAFGALSRDAQEAPSPDKTCPARARRVPRRFRGPVGQQGPAYSLRLHKRGMAEGMDAGLCRALAHSERVGEAIMTVPDPELCRCGHVLEEHDKLMPQACAEKGCICEEFVLQHTED